MALEVRFKKKNWTLKKWIQKGGTDYRIVLMLRRFWIHLSMTMFGITIEWKWHACLDAFYSFPSCSFNAPVDYLRIIIWQVPGSPEGVLKNIPVYLDRWLKYAIHIVNVKWDKI